MKTKMQLVDGPTLLTKFNGGKTTAKYPDKKAIFSQGDDANAIFYIEKGRVKLTVVSKRGKEAIIAILAVGDFFGEGCLANQTRRMATATAMSDWYDRAHRQKRDDPRSAGRSGVFRIIPCSRAVRYTQTVTQLYGLLARLDYRLSAANALTDKETDEFFYDLQSILADTNASWNKQRAEAPEKPAS